MDYEVSQQKPAGTYRIAYLGDSFIEGTCADEDTVPSFIRRNLTVSGFEKVEVINAATSSYAPTLYYLLLKTKLLSFAPDLIVINIDMTDVFDDSLYRATLTTDEKGDPVASEPGHPALATHRRTERGLEELSALQRAVQWGARHSSALRLALDFISEFRRQQKTGSQDAQSVPQAFAWCSKSRSPQTEDDIRWSMSMLSRTIRLAKSNGIKVVVTAVPHREQLEGVWSTQPMRDISEVCRAEGVPFLDPVEAFRTKLRNASPSSIYIPNDMHFNPAGYHMWGEIQLDFLTQVGLP